MCRDRCRSFATCIMSAARDLAKTRNIKLRLIKLTNRLDIEDIAP
jgi:hypothetical protein